MYTVQLCSHVYTYKYSWQFFPPYLSTALVINLPSKQLARAACMHCHGTKCPLLTVLFFFFFSLAMLLFSQKELSKGFEILHGVLSDKKLKLKLGDWSKIENFLLSDHWSDLSQILNLNKNQVDNLGGYEDWILFRMFHVPMSMFTVPNLIVKLRRSYCTQYYNDEKQFCNCLPCTSCIMFTMLFSINIRI